MAINRRWENSYKGKNLLLQSLFDVADRFHMTNVCISEQLKAIDKDVRASDGTVSAWRRGETNPCGKTPEVISKFLERYKDIVPEQTTIPETATLVDRQPPKDKRDGEVLIYRIDNPWKTERSKLKKEAKPTRVLSDAELWEYALQSMPDEKKNEIIKRFLGVNK